jgi:hypothetical protein
MFARIYNEVVNFLSFSRDHRELRNRINISIDLPEVITEFPDSHPRGFIKEFRKRRTTIVETYLKITKSLDSGSHNQRIQALRLLAEHITYSRSLKMPLNAARVQLAIMKEVVKNRDDKRVQLELMRDFTVSSFGHIRTIRRYLKKFDIIEVPETGEELRDLKMGWDFHVHDSSSYGLKSPIQLVIDAFIKGISDLTVVYNDFDELEAVKEVLEAGKILGIKVNVALEFNALNNGLRYHYMYILPDFASKKGKFKKYLKQNTDDFKNFLNELDENEKSRKKNIRHLIRNFNIQHLPKINDGYDPESIYYLQPLTVDFNENPGERKIFSRRQLGEFLYPKLKKVLERRALQITALKEQLDEYPDQFAPRRQVIIREKFTNIRKQYETLDPENIRMEYFNEDDQIVNECAVSNLEDIYKLARKTGAGIKYIQPLEHGLQNAVELVLENHKMLSHTEIFNAYDNIGNKEADFELFAHFIRLVNESGVHELTRFLDKNHLKYKKSQIEEIVEHFRHEKLIPSIGSDATGRSTLAPGMGFVLESRIVKHQRKHFEQHHHKLPEEISQLIYRYAKIPRVALKPGVKPSIVCLGKQSAGKKNLLGDEQIEKPISLLRAWEYLNPAIKSFLFVLIGFIPAYYTVGIEYALLWFVITGSRNMFVDVVSGKGFSPREWNNKDINWTNVAQSLFFTGFSVPILSFVKSRFDLVWTGPRMGAEYEVVKFFFINVSNGLYIASHNYLRGFDKGTIRANFFRSVMAWPLAAAFSPIGNLLMLPSIVQAKFWSDFVGAIIEGTAKYRNILSVKKKEMKNLIPDLVSEDDATETLAMLDMIFFIGESKRSRTALIRQLIPDSDLAKRLKRRMSEKKKSRKIQPSEQFFELKERIDQPGKFNELTDFIIAHYNREHSLYLLKMVSANFPKLKTFFNDVLKATSAR